MAFLRRSNALLCLLKPVSKSYFSNEIKSLAKFLNNIGLLLFKAKAFSNKKLGGVFYLLPFIAK